MCDVGGFGTQREWGGARGRGEGVRCGSNGRAMGVVVVMVEAVRMLRAIPIPTRPIPIPMPRSFRRARQQRRRQISDVGCLPMHALLVASTTPQSHAPSPHHQSDDEPPPEPRFILAHNAGTSNRRDRKSENGIV